jgi:hypothetical protein
MFSYHYLQTIAAVLIVGEITIRLLKEIFKTKEKQRAREGLLRLNWTIPDITNEIESKFFLKKYILFTYLLRNYFSMYLRWIRDPQIVVIIKSIGAIIFILVSAVILTGIMQKAFTP